MHKCKWFYLATVYFSLHCQIIYLIKCSFCSHLVIHSHLKVLPCAMSHAIKAGDRLYLFIYCIPKKYTMVWYSCICGKEMHWSIAVNKNKQQ